MMLGEETFSVRCKQLKGLSLSLQFLRVRLYLSGNVLTQSQCLFLPDNYF